MGGTGTYTLVRKLAGSTTWVFDRNITGSGTSNQPVNLLRVGNTIFMLWLNSWIPSVSDTVGISKSTDSGVTWTNLSGVPNTWTTVLSDSRYKDISGAGGIVMRDGRVIVPYTFLTSYGGSFDFYQASCIYSDNNGATWTQGGNVPAQPDGGVNRNYDEPVIVEATDGRLIMYMRCDSSDGGVSKSISTNRGLSWSVPVLAGSTFPNKDMNVGVYRLLWQSATYPKGLIVGIRSNSNRYGPMRIFYSYDDCDTWTEAVAGNGYPLTVYSGQEGYPRLAMYADGSGWLFQWWAQGIGSAQCDVVGFPLGDGGTIVVHADGDANKKYYGQPNTYVQFNGSAEPMSAVTSWHWDFGDGFTSPLQSPIHAYTNVGIFTARLTVNGDSSKYDTATVEITQSIPPLNPNAGGPYQVRLAPPAIPTVQFVGTILSGVGPFTWEWNFGDGSAVSNEQNPSHQYAAVEGTYQVTLRVTDANHSTPVPTYTTVNIYRQVVGGFPYLIVAVGGVGLYYLVTVIWGQIKKKKR